MLKRALWTTNRQKDLKNWKRHQFGLSGREEEEEILKGLTFRRNREPETDGGQTDQEMPEARRG